MTGDAGSRVGGRVCAHQCKSGHAVVERAHVGPGNGVVTVGAVGGSKSGACGGVGGVVGLLPSGEVALRVATIGGSDLQVVIVVDVALRALQRRRGVRIRKGEASGGVIEICVRPANGVVARGALGHREAGRDVIRNVAAHRLGAVPLRQVAGGIAAIGGLNLQIVIVVDVAGGARKRRRRMGVGQGKTGSAVIKAGGGPTGRSVALRASCQGEGLWSAGVRWVGGLLPILQVTLGIPAIGGGNLQVVVVVDVAA